MAKLNLDSGRHSDSDTCHWIVRPVVAVKCHEMKIKTQAETLRKNYKICYNNPRQKIQFLNLWMYKAMNKY